MREKGITISTILIILTNLLAYSIYSWISIGLLIACVIIDIKIIRKLIQLFSSKKVWFLIFIYALFMLSILYSDNPREGWKIIGLRVPIFIFPAIYYLHPLNTKQVNLILLSFIVFTATLPILGIIYQIPNYIETKDSGYFYNDNLVFVFEKQAVYYATYINIAIVGLLYFFHKKYLVSIYKKIFFFLLFLLLIGFQFLLASKTSILISSILIFGYITYVMLTNISLKKGWLIILSCILLFVSLGILFPKSTRRFVDSTQAKYQFENTNPFNHFNGESNDKNWNSLNTRLAIWECALDVIKEKPFIGYGIGSAQDKLVEKYKENNFHFALESNYNSHNQYLDILLTNGLLGILSLLILFIFVISTAIQQNNILLFGVVLIFILSCLTENIWSRNQGVIFFSLFIGLLTFSSYQKQTTNASKTN